MTAEWCWISAEGHLESGTESDLLRAYAAGQVPNDNPVWCPSANVWRTMVDVLEPVRSAEHEDEGETLRRPVVTPEQADELVPSTRRDDAPWFLGEVPEDPTTRLPPPSIQPMVRTVPPPSTSVMPIAVGAGVAVGGALTAVTLVASALLLPVRAELAPGLVAGAHVPRVAEAAPVAPTGCRIRTPAVELSSFVVPGGPVELASRGSELFVGAPASRRTGIGLTLSPPDLSVKSTSHVADHANVAAVVPLSDGSFVSDRWTRSVTGTSSFTLGMTPAGFSRVSEGGLEQTAVWAVGAREAITRPSLARAPSVGWAVAFRYGDGPESVRLGWIDEQGEARGELSSYAPDAQSASAPSVAVGGDRLVLAFAERVADAWRIRLGESALGKHPSELSTFVLPSGGPGHPARSPSVAALPGERWLLAWVEGPRSEQVLRAQLLDTELRPTGDALTLGDVPGLQPGLAIAAHDGGATVAFSRDAGGQRGELLAATLACD